MGPHVPDHEVEGEEVVADTVAAVEEDAVHPSVEEGLALPQLLDINDHVENGEEDEGKAGGDQDKGQGPEIFVDGDPTIVLRSKTEDSCKRSSDQGPSDPPGDTCHVARVNLQDVARLVSEPNLENAGQASKHSFWIKC